MVSCKFKSDIEGFHGFLVAHNLVFLKNFFLLEIRVLLCSPGLPVTCCIAQSGLEFIEIPLTLPPRCWEKSYVPSLGMILLL